MIAALRFLFVAPFALVVALQEPAPSEGDAEAVALAHKVEGEVAKLRGLPLKQPVNVGVYDKARLAKFIDEQMKKEKEDVKGEWQGEAWKLLGLVPAKYDLMKEVADLLLEQIGGFYDPDTKELKLMRGFKGFIAEVLMAHELCHAVDDQYFDLKNLLDGLKTTAPDDDDRAFAVRAVVEGNATELMNRFMMKGAMSGRAGDLAEAGADPQAMQMEKALKAPPIVFRPLIDSYYGGAAFLTRGGGMLATAKRKDVTEAFLNPPLSSEQVLHPDKYWDPKLRDDPQAVTLPDLSSDLGTGWKRIGTNVLGELGVACLTTPEDAPKPDPADPMSMMEMLIGDRSTDEAEGWDGDRYDYYLGPGGTKLVVWGSVWDTEKDAKEMEEALRAPAGVAMRHARAGERLVASFVSGNADAAKITAARVKALASMKTVEEKGRRSVPDPESKPSKK